MPKNELIFYQDVYLGDVYGVAKYKSGWYCQWERNGAWCGGFKSISEAAKHARCMIGMKRRHESKPS